MGVRVERLNDEMISQYFIKQFNSEKGFDFENAASEDDNLLVKKESAYKSIKGNLSYRL